jgi:trimethylamine:corrinoid methyltransferase-like protein
VGGGSDIHARALAEARAIIEGHEPEPLPVDIVQQIRDIVARADREIAH